LRRGYRVVFLHRKGTKVPFGRVFGEVDAGFIDKYVTYKEDGDKMELSQDAVEHDELRRAVRDYHTYKNLLWTGSFETVTDYLDALDLLCVQVNQLYATNCLWYLAAAVSDFYVPPSEMSEHKIQSSGGTSGLTLRLSGVPKRLGKVVESTEGMVVSFKLETDLGILIDKARKAIKNYGVHAVVANELHTRYDKIYIVKGMEEDDVETYEKESGGVIETVIVEKIIQIHSKFIDARAKSNPPSL